jgi:hypothetical protein
MRILSILALCIFVPLGARAESTPLTIELSEVQSFEKKLEPFVKSLAPGERAAWNELLRRAASQPADGTQEIAVESVVARKPTKVNPGPARGNPGGAKATRDDAGQDELVGEAVVRGLGGKGPRVNPTDTTAIGPKQDDPGAPTPGGARAIGPKQDDPGVPPDPRSLGLRLNRFASDLTMGERAMLDWMLSRSARQVPAGRPGPKTPGGLPPGAAVSFGQALGVRAIGPKQDDPSPPQPQTRWNLKLQAR